MSRNSIHTPELEANQNYLVAEFTRLKLRLRGEAGDEAEAAVESARAAMDAPAPIDELARVFHLTAFERDVLLLCAGVEMDAELARCCSQVHGGVQRPLVSFGLCLAVLSEPHWSALAPSAALRRWRMIEIDESSVLTAGRLRIDERILHHIAGIDYLDPRLQPLLHAVSPPAVLADEHRQVAHMALDTLRSSREPIIVLNGDDTDGQRDVAAEIASRLQLHLLRISAEDLPAACGDIDAFTLLWEREAALSRAALLVECTGAEPGKPVVELAHRTRALTFIASPVPLPWVRTAIRLSVNKPAVEEQRRLWEQALGGAAARFNGALDGVAAQFRLSAQTIFTAGTRLRADVAASDLPDALLWRACRSAGRTKLHSLAQHIEPVATWDDLILPEAQRTILRQIAAQARYRLTVYRKWGFDAKGSRGLGISVLFAGETGTGKTMAAEVLANELNLDLYRIDLSAVVSKYIGETEKNLRRVFDTAEDSGAILLFDEADALFGKRSEVRDSHDRYANIEVSYLLQRMESYSGLAILTTNAKTALDTAFERRLRFIVQFPFPDQREREAIWRRVFPAAAPTEGLDYAKLSRLNVSGGKIRNIAVNAAFLAASSGPAITMAHLLQAARGDASKHDRTISDAECRGWV